MGAKRTPNDLPGPRDGMWSFIAFYLRYLRTRRGLSGEAVGKIIQCGKSKVSRIEIGAERLDWKQAVALDRAWDTGGLFEHLIWYAEVGHDPQWFAQYVEMEQKSDIIRIFESNVIPGLAQTHDYAEALIAGGIGINREQVLTERMQRQGIIGENLHLTIMLSQNALEWPIGSPEVMREQLDRLLEMEATIRILPRSWEVAAYPGLDGSFQLLSGEGFGEVAYTESPGAGRLVSSPADVRSYVARYERISAKALPESQSKEVIRKIRDQFV